METCFVIDNCINGEWIRMVECGRFISRKGAWRQLANLDNTGVYRVREATDDELAAE